MGDQSVIVAFASEEEILKGLLRLLNPESSVVYFLTGHGEHDIQQGGEFLHDPGGQHAGE